MNNPCAITIELDVHFKTTLRGQKHLLAGKKPATPNAHAGRLTRVTCLLSLAIRFDQLIRDGEITDFAEIARLNLVSRARVTQIMNFLLLAPDIQETILDWPRINTTSDPITERDIRPIAAIIDWRKQRRLWTELCDSINKQDCSLTENYKLLNSGDTLCKLK